MEGRGHIISYTNKPDVYYYRELIVGTKNYRTKKIEGVDNIEDGKRKVLEIYSEFRGRSPSPRSTQKTFDKKLRTQPVEQSVEEYLSFERERVDSGLIKYGTYKIKKQTLRNHLIPYLKEKGINKTRQIDDDTFSHYLIYRKGSKKLTIGNEITVIRGFLSNWLVKKRCIEPEVVSNKNLFPDLNIRMTDLMGNPPISEKDWRSINVEIRRWVKESTNIPKYQIHLWRMIFWSFTLISKNSGCRPEELMKLRWRDVEVVDVGRISETKKQEELDELRSEGIEVHDDDEFYGGNWVDSLDTIGREERLVSYLTVTSSKTGQIREVPTNTGRVFIRLRDYLNQYYNKHFSNRQVSGNDLVLGNIYNENKPYPYSMYNRNWIDTINNLRTKLEGNRFTDERYTIYSMRSTFITNKLIEGLDIFLLSRITGHDVKILLRHYERMNIRERSEEITTIDYGKEKKEYVTVQLFND